MNGKNENKMRINDNKINENNTNSNESRRTKCGQVMVLVAKTCQAMSIAGWFEKRGQAMANLRLNQKSLARQCRSRVDLKKCRSGICGGICGAWFSTRLIMNPIVPDCWVCKFAFDLVVTFVFCYSTWLGSVAGGSGMFFARFTMVEAPNAFTAIRF